MAGEREGMGEVARRANGGQAHPSAPDRARRRQLRDEYKRAEREARAASLPMSREQLEALVEFVDALVISDGCDHTLRHTRSWVDGQGGLEWGAVAGGLAEFGGYCDCEVVMNCDPVDVFG
ncbi:DUF2695 domain-containing protein [Saccharothrix sp. NRRL B-16348]|uniref:DUF2695 domain-containing protein n=1 Tax=Saccharothrix sp. NRRL B-16348 TaxID=1415542 RepID=UPI000A82D4FA|nr:DUF2695 domain-containing protein [Saccharothrix sp. NRRL B-16348]